MTAGHTLACLGAFLSVLLTARGESLTLAHTIPLPHVDGRIDHLALDSKGARLFVAAVGNDTVEVIDLTAGQIAHTIRGLAEPQGLFFVPGLNRLYVANGGNGTLRVFDGTTFAPIATVKFTGDADNIRYEEKTQCIYVGFGDGALGIVDTAKNAILADVPVGAHPESFQLEHGGERIFVNVPRLRQISVIDRAQRKVAGTWTTGAAAGNFPMALDEAHHRLFVGCRAPARLLILDTDTGHEVAALPLHRDCDDLFFDAPRHQLYASCGEGYIDIFRQTDADHCVLKESAPTVVRARTCFFDGRQIYLAVPNSDARGAEVRVYDVR